MSDRIKLGSKLRVTRRTPGGARKKMGVEPGDIITVSTRGDWTPTKARNWKRLGFLKMETTEAKPEKETR